MSRALVTGAAGFIGRRVVDLLKREGHEVSTFEVNDSPSLLGERVSEAEVIFHFAGSNRPPDPSEFERVNSDLTKQLCAIASRSSSKPVVVLASSIQVLLDNPYGVSKRHAEQALERFAKKGGRAVIFRLPNVFGPGCRPHYNSVVATFAYNVVHALPLDIHDPSRELSLVYVHDVATAMLGVIHDPPVAGRAERREVFPVAQITLEHLAQTLKGYRDGRKTAVTPSVSDEFGRKLYATYLSHLEPGEFAYDLMTRSDERGELAEFLKSAGCGQLFISRTRPGATRGNHYHHTKTEKFLVVEGQGVIRFRRVDDTQQVIEYPVKGTDFRVVDIPPDYTHSIENTGSGELVVLFWASEIFNPDAPDTMPLKV